MRKLILGLSLSTSVILLAAGCQPGSDSGAKSEPKAHVMTAEESKALVQSDIKDLGLINPVAVQEYDDANSQAFTKIFGGRSRENVDRFLSQRIRYYFAPSELDAIDVKVAGGTIRYTGWYSMPGDDEKLEKAGGEVGASNISSALFYTAAINRVNISLAIPNGSSTIDLPMTSMRPGIMQIGPGYKTSEAIPSRVVQIPAAYRQAILVHEARHADCTGGLNETDIERAQTAASYDQFVTNHRSIACGHLHVNCPASHTFAGIAACDRHAWGAYMVGAVYAAARAKKTSGDERTIMEATALDAFSRMLLSPRQMINGQYGQPDMSSRDQSGRMQ